MPSAKTKHRVRIALPAGSTNSRDIFVDGVQVGRCFKTSGIRSEGGTWVVRDLDNKSITKVPLFTLADVRDYLDPTPV